jgi:hypothetical protein
LVLLSAGGMIFGAVLSAMVETAAHAQPGGSQPSTDEPGSDYDAMPQVATLASTGTDAPSP